MSFSAQSHSHANPKSNRKNVFACYACGTTQDSFMIANKVRISAPPREYFCVEERGGGERFFSRRGESFRVVAAVTELGCTANTYSGSSHALVSLRPGLGGGFVRDFSPSYVFPRAGFSPAGLGLEGLMETWTTAHVPLALLQPDLHVWCAWSRWTQWVVVNYEFEICFCTFLNKNVF